jgi:hypothetical protein
MTFVMPMKRNSLQGIDNDVGYVFDPNKIVLRKNSVIRLGMVYENLYQKLQQEIVNTLDNTDNAATVKPELLCKASAMLSNTLNHPVPAFSSCRGRGGGSPHKRRSVVFGRINSVEAMLEASNNSVNADLLAEMNPMLLRLTRKSSARHSSMLRAASDEDVTGNGNERRGSSMARESRRLLSKAKITYRDVIEG